MQKDVTTRERTVSLLQEQLRQLGVGVDVVGLDLGSIGKRWVTGDYDSIFHGWQASATDPAMNLDFWLSSGNNHFWNPGQAKPATAWEARLDDLMREQVGASDLAERQRLFVEAQRVFGEGAGLVHGGAEVTRIALRGSTRAGAAITQSLDADTRAARDARPAVTPASATPHSRGPAIRSVVLGAP